MLLVLLLAATVRGPADVESLTAAADTVVHAQVLTTTSAWAPGGKQIFTTVLLRTIETWKGEALPRLHVLVPGGAVGDIAQTVQGVAIFRDGEEVVVFLSRRGGSTFAVERLALGKFSVGAAGAEARRALRDRRGLACEGCRPAESDDLSLDELRARVRGSAR